MEALGELITLLMFYKLLLGLVLFVSTEGLERRDVILFAFPVENNLARFNWELQ